MNLTQRFTDSRVIFSKESIQVALPTDDLVQEQPTWVFPNQGCSSWARCACETSTVCYPPRATRALVAEAVVPVAVVQYPSVVAMFGATNQS